MSVELASREVEERNSRRKESPTSNPEGIRSELAPKSTGVVAPAAAEAGPVPTELMAETR